MVEARMGLARLIGIEKKGLLDVEEEFSITISFFSFLSRFGIK